MRRRHELRITAAAARASHCGNYIIVATSTVGFAAARLSFAGAATATLSFAGAAAATLSFAGPVALFNLISKNPKFLT